METVGLNVTSLSLKTWIIIGVVTFVLTRFVLWPSGDPKEPFYVPARIPVLGHAINIYNKGSRYFVEIGKKHNLPIYSLPVPGGRVYVVNTPELLTSVDRNPKAIAFGPIAAMVIERLSGSKGRAASALRENLTGPNSANGYMNAVLKQIHHTLAPGPLLEKVTDAVTADLNTSIGALQGKETTIQLLAWFRHQFSMSSTNAIYGPKNPFKDPKVENGFWEFDYAVSNLLITPKASWTTPVGDKGRSDAWNGFIDYFRRGGHKEGSEMAKQRYEVAIAKGIPIDDIGRLEVTMIIGILTNTVPAGFWMTYYIWSTPGVLDELRGELDKIIIRETQPNGRPKLILRSANIKQDCPLLYATMQETLRMRTCGISSRIVTEDIVLNDQYLVKKDSVMELPNNIIHSAEDLWGPTVRQFNHKRFVKGHPDYHVPKNGFRPFGGGVSLCAGRHQAASQLLSALGYLVAAFDISPTEGAWDFPGAHGHTIAAAMDSPDHDVQVRLQPRQGYEDAVWTLEP